MEEQDKKTEDNQHEEDTIKLEQSSEENITTDINEDKQTENSTKISELVFGDAINGIKGLGTVYMLATFIAISAVLLLMFYKRVNTKIVLLLLIIAFVMHAYTGKTNK